MLHKVSDKHMLEDMQKLLEEKEQMTLMAAQLGIYFVVVLCLLIKCKTLGKSLLEKNEQYEEQIILLQQKVIIFI